MSKDPTIVSVIITILTDLQEPLTTFADVPVYDVPHFLRGIADQMEERNPTTCRSASRAKLN